MALTGRPTSYSDDMIEKSLHYLENYREYGDQVPMVVGLCKVLNRGQSTLYDWAKDPDKKAFSDILNAVQEAQHNALINGGLSGEFNSPIAKMMLVKHGYSDKQEVEQKSESTVTHKIDAVDNFAAILAEYKKD